MNLEQRVNKAVKEMLSLGYKPQAFITMQITYGTVNAIKSLINNAKVTEGFMRLWKLNRLDLSLENIIQEKEWDDFFTEEERRKARKRLEDYNFKNY